MLLRQPSLQRDEHPYPGHKMAVVVPSLPTPVATTVAYSFADGFPRSWLGAVLQAFPGNRSVPKLVCLHFEALRKRLLNPHNYTMHDLFHARDVLRVKLTDGTLRSSMKLTEGLIWSLNGSSSLLRSTTKTTSKGGRPEQHYQALPVAEVERNLLRWAEPRIEEAQHRQWKTAPPLTPTMIDVLDGDAQRAAREIVEQLPRQDEETRKSAYFAWQACAELRRSLKDHDPALIALDCHDMRKTLFATENDPDQEKGYREIVREYGVSLGGVAPFVHSAGFQVDKQYAEVPITSSAKFKQQLAQARKAHRGFPCALIETTALGVSLEHYFHPNRVEAGQQIVATALEAGSTIQLKIRMASKYRRIDVQTEKPTGKSARRASRIRIREKGQGRSSSYFGKGHNPVIVLKWLKTHLRRLGWKQRPEGRWIDSYGEVYNLG